MLDLLHTYLPPDFRTSVNLVESVFKPEKGRIQFPGKGVGSNFLRLRPDCSWLVF